jgi:hypothetical protein
MRLPAPFPAITLVVLLGALLAQTLPSAHAQWKWRDESGRVHYSDQPPPKSVPPAEVRQLGLSKDPAVVGPAGVAPVGSKSPEPGKATTWQDRALELRKREAAREAKAREEESRKEQLAAQSRLCEALRGEERSLESGLRIARVNREGEPVVLDDEERGARLKAVQHDLKAHCPVS